MLWRLVRFPRIFVGWPELPLKFQVKLIALGVAHVQPLVGAGDLPPHILQEDVPHRRLGLAFWRAPRLNIAGQLVHPGHGQAAAWPRHGVKLRRVGQLVGVAVGRVHPLVGVPEADAVGLGILVVEVPALRRRQHGDEVLLRLPRHAAVSQDGVGVHLHRVLDDPCQPFAAGRLSGIARGLVLHRPFALCLRHQQPSGLFVRRRRHCPLKCLHARRAGWLRWCAVRSAGTPELRFNAMVLVPPHLGELLRGRVVAERRALVGRDVAKDRLSCPPPAPLLALRRGHQRVNRRRAGGCRQQRRPPAGPLLVHQVGFPICRRTPERIIRRRLRPVHRRHASARLAHQRAIAAAAGRSLVRGMLEHAGVAAARLVRRRAVAAFDLRPGQRFDGQHARFGRRCLHGRCGRAGAAIAQCRHPASRP